MKEEKIAQTYLYFKDKCFFISTIDRESSAVGAGRYSETIVWEYDIEQKQNKNMIIIESGCASSIQKHIEIVDSFYEKGWYLSSDELEDECSFHNHDENGR